MGKVKIALIGLNSLSHAHHTLCSIKKQNDIFDFVGYVLPENEREKFPHILLSLDGYPELSLDSVLNDAQIEAVAVETEEIHLTKYATLAAKHGKHIHMEKPGGINFAEFEELIGAVKRSGKVFHMGYMYRYNPYVEEIVQKVKSNEFGKVISVEAQMNCRHEAKNREWLKSFPGGMMFFLGCHLVDLILQIKGKPDNIIPLNRSTGVDGVTAKDFGMAVFEYPDGVSFAKTCACEVGGFSRRQLVVTFEKGTIELNPFETLAGDGQFTTKTEYTDINNWFDKGITCDSAVYDRYDPMLASFAEMVCGEKQNPWSYDYELELYKSILKACEVME